ncbi:MAG: diphthine--ammonia ligase [Bacteroidota bacterium]
MKLFASWSGGKDCMLAFYRMLKQNHHEITHLVNMCDVDTQQSRSHGLSSNLIKQQAQSIGIELIQEGTDFKGYETNFKRVINNLKTMGVEGGIFGDIYLQAHRDWIERVCGELEITPFFPLWQEDTQKLLNEFVESGFQANIVSVRKDKMSKEWLGRKLGQAFLNEISQTDIDPCAENGEYHTFVHDGPVFNHAVNIQTDGIRDDDKHWFLNIN